MRPIAGAIAELEQVAGQADEDARDILEFQIAMLGDDALSEAAFAVIADGGDAAGAWQAALDTQVDDYANAEDEYFRARSADLADLRDRVLRILSGARQQSVPAGTVLVALDLPPSRFLGIDWQAGAAIALAGGSPTSHVALAGARPRRAHGGRPGRRRDAGPERPGSHDRRRARHSGGGAGRSDARRRASARGGDQEAAGCRRQVPACAGQAAERRSRDGDDQRRRTG